MPCQWMPLGSVEVVLEVDDHRVADLELERRARDLPVEGLGVRRHAVADVDGRLVGDDRRLDDVRVGIRVGDDGTLYGSPPEVARARPCG